MDKTDLLVLIVTAIAGFATGFYLYAMVFAPNYVADKPQIVSDSEFTIMGEFYGGCRSQCPSFRLTSDRKYQYLPEGIETADGSIRGTYPRVEFVELRRVLEKSEVVSAATDVTSTQCASFADGIDANYRVTLDGEEYELDTCRTALSQNRALAEALAKIFMVLDDPGSFSYNREDYQRAGVIGYIFPNLDR